MKTIPTISTALLTLILVACGTPSQSQLQSEGKHFQANHCEIFVDQVSIFRSSHGTHGVNFYVKTINDHLDGDIAEVGLRYQSTTTTYQDPTQWVGEWTSEPTEDYFGATDYSQISQYLGSDYGTRTAVGAFYVRTSKGTNYWLKNGTEDFKINDDLYFQIRDLHYAHGTRFYSKLHTQDHDVLRKLNPNNCY